MEFDCFFEESLESSLFFEIMIITINMLAYFKIDFHQNFGGCFSSFILFALV